MEKALANQHRPAYTLRLYSYDLAKEAASMAGISDGAIVGSAIIKLLEAYGKDAPRYVGEYVKSMKDALR